MSLETTIADLVSAANNLTSAVNGKMGEIDQKVDEATEAVPQTIRSLSEVSFVVDAVEGDDAGTGKIGSPFKTIARVQQELVNGTSTVISLKEGQVHEADGTVLSLQTGAIRFARWGNSAGVGNPTIHWKPSYSSSYEANRGRLCSLDSGTVTFSSVYVKGENPDNGFPLYYLDGIFYTNNSSAQVFFGDSKVELNEVPLFPKGNNTGRSNVALFLDNTEIAIVSNATGKAMLIEGVGSNPPVYVLGVRSVTIPVDVSWGDLVPINTAKSNLLTNLDLSTV